MAKVRDAQGHEIDGKSVVAEAQMRAFVEYYDGKRGPAARKTKANARAEERTKLSPIDQLAKLDRRLGVGIGAKKERARLSALVGK